MKVTLEDNRIEVKAAIGKTAVAWLHEASGELEAQVKRNTKVKTGKTKGSWSYRVNADRMEGYIGSNYENAIWEEFGTGEYALNGDGRKGGWVYYDASGKMHFTRGKKPRRALFRAFTSIKGKLIQMAEAKFNGI